MKFQDARGRACTLTPVQAIYLQTADLHGFDCGWGGLRSTLTVRILEERGLITLVHVGLLVPGRDPRWRVRSLTTLGEDVLARWRARGR